MLAKTRRKLSMSVRSLEFSQAHPDDDPGYTAVVTQLAQIVDRAILLEKQEVAGHLDEHAAIDRRHTVNGAIADTVRHIARVCRAASVMTPELSGQIRAIRRSRPIRAFIAAAQVILDEATTHKDLLLQFGLGATTTDDLTKLLAQFQSETATSHVGRNQHSGAHTELDTLMGEAVLAVGILDGLNRARFKPGSEELGAWKSATNVAGPFKRSTPVASPPAPTPPAPAPAPDVDAARKK
jgi:hypothetical protein